VRVFFILNVRCSHTDIQGRHCSGKYMQDEQEVWWLRKRKELLAIAGQHLNAYVYDLESIEKAANDILSMSAVSRVLYAMKANFNADVLRTLANAGADFDCVSPGEVRHLREILPDGGKDRILFTPNFAPRDEYEWGIKEGLRVTLDNLYPLKAWPELFAGQQLFIRVDPDQGGGHHEHVVTVGKRSKFGVSLDELDEMEQLLKASGASVVGIHAHSGSGILEPENWHAVANALLQAAERFPEVNVLDLGGGSGAPEKRSDPVFDLAMLDRRLSDFRKEHPKYELWLEPGRYLVAMAGVLLTHVTQLKGKSDMRYVGVSTGINSLIRPALYDAYHEIVNLSKIDVEATETVTVVGPICETGDKFGSDRLLPPSQESDVVLIANTGAYGRVMSSSYNLRDIPPEITI